MIFNEHVKIREEKFGAVIFETLKEKVFVTNESGKEILNLLKEGHSPEEIIEILKASYGDGAAEIGDDVMGFVAQLKKGGIIN